MIFKIYFVILFLNELFKIQYSQIIQHFSEVLKVLPTEWTFLERPDKPGVGSTLYLKISYYFYTM